tara:strand:- start:74 stop:265 length:192 start_codon:yes stop_codon:yes gene_type:complete
LKIGNNKVIDRMKAFELSVIILERFSLGINPPEDMLVKARLNESRSLKSTNVYKKIQTIVEDK